MWFKESNEYFCKTEKSYVRDINDRGFSNPNPNTWYSLARELVTSQGQLPAVGPTRIRCL